MTISSDVQAQFPHVGTHQTHCCARHGCKYGDATQCAVEAGAVVQAYPCEYCYSTSQIDAKIKQLQEEREWSAQLEARGLRPENDIDW